MTKTQKTTAVSWLKTLGPFLALLIAGLVSMGALRERVVQLEKRQDRFESLVLDSLKDFRLENREDHKKLEGLVRGRMSIQEDD